MDLAMRYFEWAKVRKTKLSAKHLYKTEKTRR
jgi:hypothetical protein